MPKKLPKAAKDRAFKLYLTDEFSAKEIADQVNAEQRVVMSEQTIYAWIRQDDWKEKKAETQAKAMEKMQDKQSFNIAKLTEEHFEFIRYGMQWKKWVETVERIKASGINIIFLSTINNLSLFKFKEFVDKYPTHTITQNLLTWPFY